MTTTTTLPPVYGAPVSSQTPSSSVQPTAPAATSSSTAGTGGSFAGGASSTAPASSSLLGSVLASPLAAKILAMSPGQFFGYYQVSNATEQQNYMTNGKLNNNAVILAAYQAEDQQNRQALQLSMVNLGLMPASAANGLKNTTANGGR